MTIFLVWGRRGRCKPRASQRPGIALEILDKSEDFPGFPRAWLIHAKDARSRCVEDGTTDEISTSGKPRG
ncbi:hypothetical protein NAG18_19900, partial [Pseudomonas aeruginosa]|nr:hypothetical protein [Pseudomonas aeruginosa]